MEFRILGPLEVVDGQQTVRLGAAKQRALLGVLLLHANETVSSARLVDELWGESPPPTAEKLVQGYVHALRKTLGAGVVVTRAPGYELRVEDGCLDVQEFERLIDEARAGNLEQAVELRAQALALWRGPPLADVVLEGPERNTLARLSELRLTTQIERIDAELALGRGAQLVGELESLAAANPYQERVAAQLMLALYRSGRQAEALHAYQTVRRALSDELGLQPGQELRGLEAAILRQDETLTPDRNVARGAPPPTEPQSSPPAPSRGRHSRLVPALAILVALGVVATAILVFRGEPAPVTVPPNSVAVIDAKTNKLVTTVPVGIRPGPIAAGGGFVWVGNLQDRNLSKLGAQGTLVGTFPLDNRTPTGLAVGADAVWVAHGRLGQLSRVDPQFGQVTETVEPAGRGPYSTNGSVTTGVGSVWAVFGDSTLARVDPDDVRRHGLDARGRRAGGCGRRQRLGLGQQLRLRHRSAFQSRHLRGGSAEDDPDWPTPERDGLRRGSDLGRDHGRRPRHPDRSRLVRRLVDPGRRRADGSGGRGGRGLGGEHRCRHGFSHRSGDEQGGRDDRARQLARGDRRRGGLRLGDGAGAVRPAT